MTKEEKKAKLRAELEALEKDDNDSLDACVAEIMKIPEIKQIKELCVFNQKWEMQVSAKVECDFWVTPLHGKKDEFSEGGNVYVKIMEPKGYNVEPFFNEDCIGNLGMNNEMSSLSPEVNQQFKELWTAEKALQKKATTIAKKHGYNWDDVVDLISDEIMDSE